MSIGIIIFVISVVISIISAMRDNSHKDRQNQKPPRKTTNSDEPQKGGIFGELERTFKEFTEGLDDEEETSSKRKYSETTQPVFKEQPDNTQYEETVERKEQPAQPRQSSEPMTTSSEQMVTTSKRDESREALKQELESSLDSEIKHIRSEMDRQQEKRLALIEKKARAVIADKHLSERAKRLRLEQLLKSTSANTLNVKNDRFRFDNDEVINGLIWSEILSKPKQL